MAHRSQRPRGRDSDGALGLARGLGWFSIGLGFAELVAPGHLARLLGMEERTDLIRLYGAREIATGVGILAQEDPTTWMWGRVGGDVVDLATLATGLGRDNPQRENVGRRGMPRPPQAMRGVARDFMVPRDMRIPEAMRPHPKLA
jgi:hypothetical protein